MKVKYLRNISTMRMMSLKVIVKQSTAGLNPEFFFLPDWLLKQNQRTHSTMLFTVEAWNG